LSLAAHNTILFILKENLKMASPQQFTDRSGSNRIAVQPEKKKPLQFLDLKAQFASIREDVLKAVEGVFESQHFILGKEVQLLEQEIASFVGVPEAVGCASGSDALYLSLLALHIGRDDEVITTPFTFVATAGAIARTGAKPVFVDIDPVTYNIDPRQIEAAITPKTRAIIPVHLFGLAADLDPILEIANRHNVAVVEDAAQAIGATYGGRQVGSFGLCGCFSFFPSKNLGCAGDGGLITTTDAKIADELRLLRAHGSRKKYQYEILGTNSRLDALHAAILRVKLPHLDDWAEKRCEHAEIYKALFEAAGLTNIFVLPSTPKGRTHVYNQFVVRVPRREELRAFLDSEGIPTDVYYPSPLHVQPAFSYLGYGHGSFPESEKASKEVLALPVYPELSRQDQGRVVDTISDFCSSNPA
jgi:dTDP-4-amino-4,6-dideoxygalactose transaminase